MTRFASYTEWPTDEQIARHKECIGAKGTYVSNVGFAAPGPRGSRRQPCGGDTAATTAIADAATGVTAS